MLALVITEPGGMVTSLNTQKLDWGAVLEVVLLELWVVVVLLMVLAVLAVELVLEDDVLVLEELDDVVDEVVVLDDVEDEVVVDVVVVASKHTIISASYNVRVVLSPASE